MLVASAANIKPSSFLASTCHTQDVCLERLLFANVSVNYTNRKGEHMQRLFLLFVCVCVRVCVCVCVRAHACAIVLDHQQ